LNGSRMEQLIMHPTALLTLALLGAAPDDPLPPGAIARLGTVRFRHGDQINAVVVAPDGKLLATGSRDGTLALWDVETGKEVAWSPDGRLVASGSKGANVLFWDAATAKNLLTAQGHKGAVTALAFAPGGQRLASGSLDKTIRLWDPADGSQKDSWAANTGGVA